MRMLSGMFVLGWNMSQVINLTLDKALKGKRKAALKRNQSNIRTARALLVAYGLARKAERDISYFRAQLQF